MRRTALCLLIVLASAGADARESKLSAPGDACPGHSARQSAARATEREAAPVLAPANKTKVQTTRGGGDSDGPAGRIPSPRWHRFLPGMFR